MEGPKTQPADVQAGEIKSKKKHEGSIKTRRIVSNVIVYIILILMSIIWLIPVVWLVLQSFGTETPSLAAQSRWWPQNWGFENYYFIATNKVKTANGQILTSAFNFFWSTDSGKFVLGGFMYTLIIAAITAILSTLFCLATSYAFSRLRFKARKPMMRIILILGMFPGFLGLIILYNFFKMIYADGHGVTIFYQSIWGLILIYSGGAGMGYYISKGFFDTISKQIDEAAMVDGATRFQIFYKITLPLSKPIVVYTVLTSFMGPWAEYITSSYILGSAQNNQSGTTTTVANILYVMVNATEKDLPSRYWGQFCAGAVIVAIPTSLLFIALQKNYVSGVTGGAVKG